MSVKPIFAALLAAALILPAFPAAAADAQTYNQLHFNVRRVVQVENDSMRLVVRAQAEHEDPTTAASEVNRVAGTLREIVAGYDGIRLSTRQYQTVPMRDKDARILWWRTYQDVEVTGEDFKAMAELAGKLQRHAQILEIRFFVSQARRDALEESLTRAAVRDFRARASVLVEEMQARGYKLVNMNIGASQPPPVMSMMRATAMDATESFVPPSFDAGSSEMEAVVNGSIELLYPRP